MFLQQACVVTVWLMPARIDGSPWSGDGDRATWQGERTKAQEASFLQRCVKKRRSKEGKFASPEAMLKCPGFRASVLYVRGLRAPAPACYTHRSHRACRSPPKRHARYVYVTNTPCALTSLGRALPLHTGAESGYPISAERFRMFGQSSTAACAESALVVCRSPAANLAILA